MHDVPTSKVKKILVCGTLVGGVGKDKAWKEELYVRASTMELYEPGLTGVSG